MRGTGGIREELRDADDREVETTDMVSDLSLWVGELSIVVARCRTATSG